LPIFPDPPPKPGEKAPPFSSLRGFTEPADDWALDWRRFIDIDSRPNGFLIEDGKVATKEQYAVNQKRLQLAYRIDTSLVNPLGSLPKDIADRFIQSLAKRNLLRGWRLRLPSGQAVARAMGVVPLQEVLIGKFQDKVEAFDIKDLKEKNDKDHDRPVKVFEDNCPLWTYCLAETNRHTTPGLFGIKSHQLGEVGGQIVAETFAGLLTFDSQSFFGQDPRWTPKIGDGKTFGLKEFVQFATGGLCYNKTESKFSRG